MFNAATTKAIIAPAMKGGLKGHLFLILLFFIILTATVTISCSSDVV